MSDDEIISGFVSELRRGTVVLGVLNQLSSPKYGYSLGQELTEKGVPVDGNTLYPLLRRLEKQGLLKSEWDMSEGKPRKYYVRTAKGTKINAQLRDYWIETVVNISTLMKEE
ncbi:MAG: PadR family transcriptional regulator [Oscillospiraceae bacterium]